MAELELLLVQLVAACFAELLNHLPELSQAVTAATTPTISDAPPVPADILAGLNSQIPQ